MNELVLPGQKKPVLFLAIAGILLGVFLIYPMVPTFILFCGFIWVLSIFSPRIGLLGAIMTFPFPLAETGGAPINVIVGALTSALVGTMLNYIVNKESKIGMLRNIPHVFLLGLVVFGLIIGAPNHHLLFLFILNLWIASEVAGAFRTTPGFLYQIMTAVSISGLLALSLAFYDAGTLMGPDRLGIHNNVRRLANTLGLAILLIFVSFALAANRGSLRKVYIVLGGALVVYFFIGVIATASRGVIVSTLGATVVLLFVQVFATSPARERINTGATVLFGFLIIALTFAFMADYHLTGARGIERLFDAVQSGDDGARAAIWSAGVGQMNGHHWILGAGLNSFREIATHDRYAHSLFVDTLVATGIIGLIILLGLIGWATSLAIRKKNFFVLPFVAFIFINFSTHGHVLRYDVWLLIGIIQGAALSHVGGLSLLLPNLGLSSQKNDGSDYE